jgi:hypothetical protein
MTTNGTRALLSADTDRTLDYVFESAKLPEIRGASTILDDLNRQAAPQLIKRLDDTAQKIYASGGSLLYEVAAEKAPLIQQELEALYPRETGVATITCVYRVLPGPADKGIPQAPADAEVLSGFQRERWERADESLDCFGAWVRLLGRDLRRRKQEKRYAPFVEAMPHAERCQSCRIRPASTTYAHYGEAIPRCTECAQKNEASPRSPWRDRFESRLRELHKEHPELIRNYFAGAQKGTVPLDINVIASACDPRNRNKRNYVAFIYADGDGVGSFVESRHTRDEYRKSSKSLRDATWYAVTFALAHNLAIQTLDNPMSPDETEEERRRPTQPFEIITVGGDDVMLVVPAHVALQVARDLAGKFTEYLAEKLTECLEREGVKGKDRPLTLSVGVVIAPMHMPVRLMRDFARELLKRGAKQRARKEGEAAVDFQVFTSTALQGTDVMTMRRQPPYTVAQPDDPEGKPLHLFRRPYTLPELKRLLAALDALSQANFPTSQLYPLAAALGGGRHRGTLFYLYQRSRLRKQHREALAQVEAIVEVQPGRDPLPWYRATSPEARYAFSTLLRDVAELYDFAPALEGEEVVS